MCEEDEKHVLQLLVKYRITLSEVREPSNGLNSGI